MLASLKTCLEFSLKSKQRSLVSCKRGLKVGTFSDNDILGEIDRAYNYNQTHYWHPSDQPKALERLESRIKYIDAVVEIRDARIPLSSINPRLSESLGTKPRLVVYNKVDLSSRDFDWNKFRHEVGKYSKDKIICTQAINSRNIYTIIDWAKLIALACPHLYPYMCLVVVGLPNVGKSTVINKLRERGVRGKKALKVGANAGVTRTVQTRIKICMNPPIYLVDTPGIFEPHFSHPINALKLALTGAMKDSRIDAIAASAYLLHRMNATPGSRNLYTSYFDLSSPCESISSFLEVIAKRYNIYNSDRYHEASQLEGIIENEELKYALTVSDIRAIAGRERDSRYDLVNAAFELIRIFRTGAFGKFTFDDCSPNIIEAVFSHGGPAKTLTARRFAKIKRKSHSKPKPKPQQRKRV